MTSYNREKYIAEAIESVLASTYSNFELIVSDDCSNDRTVEIAKAYAIKDHRVKVFINEKNIGDYPNRNKAASYAKGKYLKYVDADDMIYPWGLKILFECMERYPEAGWGLCSLEQDVFSIFPFVLNSHEIYKYNFWGPGLFHKAPLSSIIKRELFESIGGFTGKKHLGDFEMWHKLAIISNLVLMPQGIVWHRIHDAQESNENRTETEVSFKYFVTQLNFFKTSNSIPLSEVEKKIVIKRLEKKIFKMIFVNIKNFKLKNFIKLYKASKNKMYNFE